LGLVLTLWLGPLAAALVIIDIMAVHFISGGYGPDSPKAMVDAAIAGSCLMLGWCFFVRLSRGSLRLNDPTSATLFLLLVPGAAVGLGAVFAAALEQAVNPTEFIAHRWVTNALSILAVAPPLLLTLTPWLKEAGLAPTDPKEPADEIGTEPWTLGEALEVSGLSLGAAILGLALTARHVAQGQGDWLLWAILLLLTVWAGLRQGLRGSAPAAGAAAMMALVTAAQDPGHAGHSLLPLQGNLMALCSTALLVGASTGWIRASETRYRQIIGHVPIVLYSAHLFSPPTPGNPPKARVTLVGSASGQVFGRSPEEMLGDYAHWLALVHGEDREIVLAGLAQLCRQNQPVTCEYRLTEPFSVNGSSRLRGDRWVRDTLSPRYGDNGRLQGWDGVAEDVTERRLLAQNLRRTSSMLHSLVANLPAGVVFVQGPSGRPTLVNARARQLLGQREDSSADVSHFPELFRLHRPDGSRYPWEELPVAQALRRGLTSMRDDIVVHRRDGRRIPLVAWAAPVVLEESGRNDAAVWVLEDRTALHQAEAARLESEARLRTVFETMAEGLIVQDENGAVMEWNPAACTILGVPVEAMAGRTSLGPTHGCLREDGSPFPREEQPDRECRRTRRPVRNVVVGIPMPAAGALRWILVNALPLPQPGKQRGIPDCRVVSTFTDITAYRPALAVAATAHDGLCAAESPMPG
jgi:PAS domain S-box-containing protein